MFYIFPGLDKFEDNSKLYWWHGWIIYPAKLIAVHGYHD